MEAESLRLFLPLGLDDPDGLLVREQKVIDRADVRRVFPNRDAPAGMEVNVPLVLDYPARGEKEFVYPVPGALLGILIHN